MSLRWSAILIFCLCFSTLAAQQYQLSKPLLKVEGDEFFKKQTQVSLDFRLEGANVHYTLDGSEPTEQSARYKKPLRIRQNQTIKARAFKAGFLPSEVVSKQLIKIEKALSSIELNTPAQAPYEGNGGQTLIDQQAGSVNFRDGRWLGFNKGPVSMTIDLGKKKGKETLIVSALSDPGSWIMQPTAIQAYFSQNGTDFTEGPSLKIPAMDQPGSSGKIYYELDISERKGQYLKLVISLVTSLPQWHPGKGNAGWLFLDEILIRY